MDKDELRRAMRMRRRTFGDAQQEAASLAVLAHVKAFAPYAQAKTVMAYMACRGELSLAPVINDLLAQGKMLVLPRCEAPGVMTARKIESLAQLVPGAYGLLEPGCGSLIVPPQEIDLVLVPGTAFDRTGGRIGQGGGYYDRFLPRTRALRAGVCHEFAMLDHVPCTAHDVHMDVLITPAGVIRADRDTSEHRRSQNGK